MTNPNFYVPPGGPPESKPNPQIYHHMGTENIYKDARGFLSGA